MGLLCWGDTTSHDRVYHGGMVGGGNRRVAKAGEATRVTAQMTVSDAAEERLRVRERYTSVLSDYDRSETRTRELRAIAVYDCELTALIEGNLEAKALMQMRTMQIGMLLVREPSAGNSSAFEQMLQSARSRGASPALEVQPASMALPEPERAPVPCPPAPPTGAQAVLLSIVPKSRRPPEVPPDAAILEARSVIALHAASEREQGKALPAAVVDACRLLVSRGVTMTEVCQLADMPRMTLHRHGIRARPT